MIKKIYIAGPLFNIHEKKYLEEIANVLESNGYDCFLPHRDQTGIDPEELKNNEMSQSTKNIIFQTDIKALQESDLIVALVTGQDIDSGTASEIGYMYANNKPVIAITAEERRYRNLFTEGMFTKIIYDVDQVLNSVRQFDS